MKTVSWEIKVVPVIQLDMRTLFVGAQSGFGNTTGHRNICIGTKSCISGSNSNRIVIGINTDTAAVISDYSREVKPGDGNIVIGQPEDPKFLKERKNSLAINNIIEGDFAKKEVLVKDDLKVKRNLHVGGNIQAPFILAQVSTPSDGRIKNVLGDLSPEDSLKKLLSLRAVRYTYKKEGKAGGEHLGFLANEVEKVVPEIVRKNGEEEMRSMNYQELLPLVIEGMKKMNEKMDSLKLENKELRKIVEKFSSSDQS